MAEKVQAATREYRDAEDQLAQWVAECCVTGQDAFRCRAGDLYANYKTWSERAGEQPLGNRLFSDAMGERGFEKHISNGTWYVGIAVREQGCVPD
jgi:phage/plasmid-associated DNA primase